MKKTILLRITITIIIQAFLLLEANCVHAADIIHKNHSDTLAPAVYVQGKHLENGLYQLYHVLKYRKFWKAEDAKEQKESRKNQDSTRPTIESMPKSKNIVERMSSSLTQPTHKYFDYEKSFLRFIVFRFSPFFIGSSDRNEVGTR